MSDGIKAGIGQAAADVGEAVVKPVVDELGKAVEEGVSSVVSGPKKNPPAGGQDPAVQQAKQAEEAKRLSWARYVIDWYRKLQTSQEKVRSDNQQKLAQRKQEETEKKQGEQFEVMEQKRKAQQMNAVQLAGRKTEIKGGIGG